MKKFLAVAFLAVVTQAKTQVINLQAPQAGEKAVKRIVASENKSVVRIDVPACDIQMMWMPPWRAPRQERKWRLQYTSAPQLSMPYVAYFNIVGRNSFSIGVSALEYDVNIESKINQEKGVWQVTVTVAAQQGEIIKPFFVTMDRRDKAWTEVLADWRQTLEYKNGNYPEDAWMPAYCSWYARHADITQSWVERTAVIAAEMGFKTFILDDGWSYDDAKRVSPETIVDWYRDVGKWDVFSKKKFPDFKAHREKMRALNLNYIVWTAPYFVGTRALAYTQYGFDKKGDKPFEGNVLASPCDKEYMKEVDDQLVRLIKESDLDGLKIDFLDSVAPSVENPRALVTHAYLTNLMAKLRKVKPNGLFEFRQGYATPITASLATQFRAGDVPFEWLANLLRIAQIRLTMGDKVPIHSDPIFWSVYETDDNINRHFIASMAGVPMLSIDLESLPAKHRNIAKNWISFYKNYVKKFQLNGAWNVKYLGSSLQYVSSEVDDEILVIVNDPGIKEEVSSLIRNKKAVVLNLTYSELDFGNAKKVSPANAALFSKVSIK
jgi:alpha-galactosidase